jgi:16S rRNA (uracil1498-N3)-methyltransferase
MLSACGIRLIIAPMPRRLHMPAPLRAGLITLDPRQAHHARDVLRLTEGAAVELFDDDGAVAMGTIARSRERAVIVEITSVTSAASGAACGLTVASAVPKGERADWMIEKLSELGVQQFVPLETARSVVHPGRKNKRDRWQRLATESAKQSRRAGVMRIDDLTPLAQAIASARANTAVGWHLSLAGDAMGIAEAIRQLDEGPARPLHLFVGPEGGWNDGEIAAFTDAGMLGVRLTATVLRVETAALAAAAVVSSLRSGLTQRR